MSEIILNQDNFEEEVLCSSGLVLVDFWAQWCGPCKKLGPVISEIAESNESVKVGKVNIDENMELAQKYKVVSIPTLLLFKDGEVVDKSIGLVPKMQIDQMIAQNE